VVFAPSEFRRAGSVIRTVIGAFNHVEGPTMSETIAGIKIPDSKMAKDLTELIRDKEPRATYSGNAWNTQWFIS
jgi:hypothetical protein